METEHDDQILITRYLCGDREAFALLVKRHSASVFRFLRRLSGENTLAEDMTQETFIKVWKHLRRFREGETFKTWLFVIARNTAIDHLRKKRMVSFSFLSRTRAAGDAYVFEETLVDTEPTPEELAILNEEKEHLSEALMQITPPSREILILYYNEDLTFNEIGKILGKPLNTVKSQYRRALIALRKEIGKHASSR